MSKIVLFLFIVISFVGCNKDIDFNDVKDGECTSISQLHIFQTLDKGALAYEYKCKFDWDDFEKDCDIRKNQIFYILNNTNKQFFDGLKLSLNKNECFKRNGIYKLNEIFPYMMSKTLPALIIDNK